MVHNAPSSEFGIVHDILAVTIRCLPVARCRRTTVQYPTAQRSTFVVFTHCVLWCRDNKVEKLFNNYKNQKNFQYNSFIIGIKRGIKRLEKYYLR